MLSFRNHLRKHKTRYPTNNHMFVTVTRYYVQMCGTEQLEKNNPGYRYIGYNNPCDGDPELFRLVFVKE